MKDDDFDLCPPLIKLKENDVEEACLDLVRYRQFYPVRLQSGRFIMPDRAVVEACRRAGVRVRWQTVGEVGLPDYVCIKNDFFLEVKAPKKKPSAVQIEMAIKLEAAYGIGVATVDSVERLAAWLDARKTL